MDTGASPRNCEPRARPSITKLAQLMRISGVQVPPLRRFIRTTHKDHDNPIFPNLARYVVLTGPNQLWVGDITYIAVAGQFVYLAVILRWLVASSGRLCPRAS